MDNDDSAKAILTLMKPQINREKELLRDRKHTRTNYLTVSWGCFFAASLFATNPEYNKICPLFFIGGLASGGMGCIYHLQAISHRANKNALKTICQDIKKSPHQQRT